MLQRASPVLSRLMVLTRASTVTTSCKLSTAFRVESAPELTSDCYQRALSHARLRRPYHVAHSAVGRQVMLLRPLAIVVFGDVPCAASQAAMVPRS